MISFQPKFSGEVQQRVFQNYLESFPPRSLARLNRIDQIPEHNPQHIRVAQQLGKQDPNIRGLNAMIIKLVTERMQARRAEDTKAEAEATEMLSDLRVAIDAVLSVFRAEK